MDRYPAILPYARVVIYDTEYTTWEGARERNWSDPNEYKEIVQIGAVLVDTKRMKELDSFSVFVRPVKNPCLSDFFVHLTGITQEQIDTEEISFPDAITKFFHWSNSLHLYAFGTDADTLKENARLLEIPFPFDCSRFHNIREVFRAHGIDDLKYMSSTIVEAFGRTSDRKGHDGLNDARTIVDGLRLLKDRIEKRTKL